jgi:anti-sigma factor RsiW
MNDALRMQISAFIDGELPENESELLLRRLSQDAALRQQVSRYLEIGRLMRQDREIPGIDQLRGRIAAALGDEMEAQDDEQKVVGSALMTPTTGVAVAATVAALALVGLSQLGAPGDPVLQRAVAIDDGPAAYTEPDIVRALAEQPSELLLQYHASHGDSSPGLGPNGIRTRVISLERRELVEVEPDPHLVPSEADDTNEEESPVETP